mmetsp:Transcript_69874/g.227416  ORF Transcript_69874/g.227416 Transcript_69874/m.227416 type:complete len:381 (+) Transcript_69874:1225-2367(+)
MFCWRPSLSSARLPAKDANNPSTFERKAMRKPECEEHVSRATDHAMDARCAGPSRASSSMPPPETPLSILQHKGSCRTGSTAKDQSIPAACRASHCGGPLCMLRCTVSARLSAPSTTAQTAKAHNMDAVCCGCRSYGIRAAADARPTKSGSFRTPTRLKSNSSARCVFAKDQAKFAKCSGSMLCNLPLASSASTAKRLSLRGPARAYAQMTLHRCEMSMPPRELTACSGAALNTASAGKPLAANDHRAMGNSWGPNSVILLEHSLTSASQRSKFRCCDVANAQDKFAKLRPVNEPNLGNDSVAIALISGRRLSTDNLANAQAVMERSWLPNSRNLTIAWSAVLDNTSSLRSGTTANAHANVEISWGTCSASPLIGNCAPT